MADVGGLSAAFAESHPAEAARVLEGLGAGDTAGFITALAPALAVPILREMAPPYCARVFERLEEAEIAVLAQMMGPQAAARALQQLSQVRQLQVLARLPVATSIGIRMLIGYPRGTCGACMDPWTLELDGDMRAEQALRQVHGFEGQLGDCLFITNGQRRLTGVLTLDALVRANPRAPLSTLMRPAHHTVSALASTAAMVGHAAWDDYRVLPVVERENRLVGALYRRALVAALNSPMAVQDAAMAGGLLGAYWQMLSALSGLVIGTLPAVTPVAKERSRDGH